MGSGKSSTGKELAASLGWKFIDLDTVIEQDNNKSIQQIFNDTGEPGFREAEKASLLQMIHKKNVVIATGGGCAAYNDNMDWMNRNGLTVYLKTHPGTLFHRLAPDKSKRPLLAGLPDVDLMEYIIDSLKKRMLYYIRATITVSGEAEPSIVARQILSKIK